MPIYEYECLKCGEVFEQMQSHSEPPPKKHSCGSKRVKRLMSRTSFVLKGSGWYITDYGKGNGHGRSEAKDKGESKEKSETKTKKETKAAKGE